MHTLHRKSLSSSCSSPEQGYKDPPKHLSSRRPESKIGTTGQPGKSEGNKITPRKGKTGSKGDRDIPLCKPSGLAQEEVSRLQAHQTELEMQNKALRKSRIAAEESRDRFAELYEFAPIGYLTLSKNGIIVEANLMIATILCLERRELLGSRFTRFIAPEDLELWNQYRIRVTRSINRHVCELHLNRRNGGGVVTRIESIRMGRGGSEEVILVAVSDITDRVRAEQDLALTNRDLEELRAAYQAIADGQRQLRRNERELTEALEEKEALLSEIHHRVRNNLTAFISLLSLDGAQEESESARELRKDLQNRARSMALIHETLYRTGNFSNVDMEKYLSTLITHIAESYAKREIRILVDSTNVALDLSRATTAGLIVNELVTNSLKYAFPPDFDCRATRGEPCTIHVTFRRGEGTCILTVADNGIGLPSGFDPFTAKSLGLKLVNFLARHQLLAEPSFRARRGTEFIFRLHQQGSAI